LFAASSPPPQATRAAERRTLKHNRRMLATSTAGTILGELRRDLRKPAAERPRKKKSTRKKFDAAAALKYASAKKVSRPYAYATEKDIPVPSFVDVDDSTTAHNLEDSFSMYRLQVKYIYFSFSLFEACLNLQQSIVATENLSRNWFKAHPGSSFTASRRFATI